MPISKQYLNGEYILKNPTFHVEDSPWKVEQICKMLNRNKLLPKTVCEIGCGSGEIVRLLEKKISGLNSIHGFEISPQAYELCKQRETELLKFYNLNLFDLKTAKYDLVLSIDVFEHVEDYFDYLRKLSFHGKDFIFHIPLDMNVQMILRANPILYVREKVGHLHYFSKDTALAALNDTGYSVVDWFYTPSGIDINNRLLAKIARLPRRILFCFSQEYTSRILGGYSLMVYARSKNLVGDK